MTRSRGLFAGSKTGLADFDASFAMDMANQRGYFQGEEFRGYNGGWRGYMGGGRIRGRWRKGLGIIL